MTIPRSRGRTELLPAVLAWVRKCLGCEIAVVYLVAPVVGTVSRITTERAS